MKLLFRPYLHYKFLNSLFTGAVGGSIFTLYATISPSTFSIGGIVLALGLLVLAYFYRFLMNLSSFFRITLGVELIMLFMVSYFLLFPDLIETSLVIYAAYQLSYMFGGYLVRAETHFSRHARIMGWIDVSKQQGYLAGLAVSYGFYKAIEHYGVSAPHQQVYWLHFPLLVIEILIILLLLRSFKK